MKMRLVGTVLGLATSFALPTFGQQNAMVPDPKVIEQLGALGQKMYKADAKNDAAAMAACYTLDAILETSQGPFYDRDAIQNWYVDQLSKGISISQRLIGIPFAS